MTKRALRSLGIVFCLYVGFNVLLPSCVPFAHTVSVEMTVVDYRTDAPLEGVAVSERMSKPFGTTDERGKIERTLYIGGQPWWVYPPVGWFDFGGISFEFAKEGYRPNTVMLAEAAGDVSYWRAHASFVVRMKQQK